MKSYLLAALAALSFTGCANTPEEKALMRAMANRPCQSTTLSVAADVYCRDTSSTWPPVVLEMPSRF